MSRLDLIKHELTHHVPFTFFGSLSGIVFLLLFYKLPQNISYEIFYVLHPLHVLLSAIIASTMFRKHSPHRPLWLLLIVGYVGAIGVCTLSDSLIPYVEELLFNMPARALHIGFIEEWWLVNPMAIFGMIIAYFNPYTKLPHSIHVLISTWASLFHIIMALAGALTWTIALVSIAFLFVAVWLPCCFSDIVLPLLFVKKKFTKHASDH
jgi:hypothetical protein